MSADKPPQSGPGDQSPGLPRLVLEARVRLGPDATPEQVADDDARTLVLTGGLLVLGVVLWFASRAALRREVERPG